MVTFNQLIVINFGDSLRRIKSTPKPIIQKWYNALLLLKRDTAEKPIEFDYINSLITQTEDERKKVALANFLASTPKIKDYPVSQEKLDYAILHVKTMLDNSK
jgi:hypothetical protein